MPQLYVEQKPIGAPTGVKQKIEPGIPLFLNYRNAAVPVAVNKAQTQITVIMDPSNPRAFDYRWTGTKWERVGEAARAVDVEGADKVALRRFRSFCK